MEHKFFEIVCAKFGKKSYECPYVSGGNSCINCSASRYLPRQIMKKTEETEETIIKETEESNADGE